MREKKEEDTLRGLSFLKALEELDDDYQVPEEIVKVLEEVIRTSRGCSGSWRGYRDLRSLFNLIACVTFSHSRALHASQRMMSEFCVFMSDFYCFLIRYYLQVVVKMQSVLYIYIYMHMNSNSKISIKYFKQWWSLFFQLPLDFTVFLVNVNDQPPVFAENPYSITVNEVKV